MVVDVPPLSSPSSVASTSPPAIVTTPTPTAVIPPTKPVTNGNASTEVIIIVCLLTVINNCIV